MRHPCYGRAASLLLSLSLPVWGLLPAMAHAQIGIGVSITLAPPVLPVYAQPEIPGPGYLWTPGYWGYADGDYYWVPGTWVLAPQPGYLWTPGYWGWGDGAYLWHGGYWGAHIGFYGGVNYGYGYGGSGYQGGYWQHDHFFYNQSVNNIHNNSQITNVYNKTVINNAAPSRASYNGGQGGIVAQPTASERAAASESHLPPLQAQVQHEQVAHATPSLRASANHGNPPIAATAHAGVLSGPGVVAAGSRGTSPSPHEATVQHATVQQTPAQRAASQPALASAPRAALTPRAALAPPAAPTPRAVPTPRAAPERLAVRPAAPAPPHPAPPHEAAPRPPAPHPPAEHHDQGGGERER
jgi:hypothetical protein